MSVFFVVHCKLNIGDAMISFHSHARVAFLFITGCLIIIQDSQQAQCSRKFSSRRTCYFVCSGVPGKSGDVNIDLSAIDGQGSPRFKGIEDGHHRSYYQYDYNPCTKFASKSPCNGVNVCQHDTVNDFSYDIGSKPQMLYNTSEKAFILKYIGMSGRMTEVKLVHESGEVGKTSEVMENPTDHYSITLYTMYAPVGSGGGGNSGGGISTGTVLVIIFFVILVLYLGIGIAFLRYQRGAEGKDMIPHYEFWSKIPGLAKDGCVFSAKKSKECFSSVREKTNKGEQGEYEKI